MTIRQTRSLEHVKHPLCDEETTAYVDARDESGRGSQSFHHVCWIVSSSHQKHSTNSCYSGNGIGNGHQRRVQWRDYSPHGVIASKEKTKNPQCDSLKTRKLSCNMLCYEQTIASKRLNLQYQTLKTSTVCAARFVICVCELNSYSKLASFSYPQFQPIQTWSPLLWMRCLVKQVQDLWKINI